MSSMTKTRKPSLEAVRIVETQDEFPDASYLEQEGMGFEDRLAAYRRGDFYFIGVQAEATIHVPVGSDVVVQTITSPGLWGIESDSGDDYLKEVGEQESRRAGEQRPARHAARAQR
jgi:hypothetical protein